MKVCVWGLRSLNFRLPTGGPTGVVWYGVFQLPQTLKVPEIRIKSILYQNIVISQYNIPKKIKIFKYPSLAVFGFKGVLLSEKSELKSCI